METKSYSGGKRRGDSCASDKLPVRTCSNSSIEVCRLKTMRITAQEEQHENQRRKILPQSLWEHTVRTLERLQSCKLQRDYQNCRKKALSVSVAKRLRHCTCRWWDNSDILAYVAQSTPAALTRVASAASSLWLHVVSTLLSTSSFEGGRLPFTNWLWKWCGKQSAKIMPLKQIRVNWDSI